MNLQSPRRPAVGEKKTAHICPRLMVPLQRRLDAEGYGPSLSDMEKQIAAHNILHQEIEAYSEQLTPSTTSSQVA